MINVNIIFIFLTYVFLEILVIQLGSQLLNLKIKNKLLTFIVIVINAIPISIVGSDNFIDINNSLYNVICIYVAFCRLILYMLVFRKINLKVLYIYFYMMLTNQIYSNMMKNIFDESIIAGAAFAAEALVLGAIAIYIKKKNKGYIYRDILGKLPKKLYVLILIMLFIAAIFVMGSTMENHEIYEKYLLMPSMIGLVISIVAVIKISISETEEKSVVNLLSKQVEGQVEYYEKINKIYGEFRSFRHDYKNHVLCLRSLIAADKKAEALEYMETMQNMSSLGKNKYNTGNVIIDALLDDKSDQAENTGIELDFNGVVPNSGISNADLCVIMANAIDNAIEACSKDKSSDKKIIKVDADIKQGYFLFRASNPIFEEVKFNEKNKVVTSKSDKEHHGFGVANIIRTSKKYDGTTDISTDNDEFTIEVHLLLKQSVSV